jgi:hypothetical protein
MKHSDSAARTDLAARLNLCPEGERVSIRAKIASARFRTLTCRNGQIRYLFEEPDKFSTGTLSILFGLSKSTISDVVNRKHQLENGSNRDENGEQLFSSNRQILTHSEEEVLL